MRLGDAFRFATPWQAGVPMGGVRYDLGVIENLGSTIDGSAGVGLGGGTLLKLPQPPIHLVSSMESRVWGFLGLCSVSVCRLCMLVCWSIASCLHSWA